MLTTLFLLFTLVITTECRQRFIGTYDDNPANWVCGRTRSTPDIPTGEDQVPSNSCGVYFYYNENDKQVRYIGHSHSRLKARLAKHRTDRWGEARNTKANMLLSIKTAREEADRWCARIFSFHDTESVSCPFTYHYETLLLSTFCSAGNDIAGEHGDWAIHCQGAPLPIIPFFENHLFNKLGGLTSIPLALRSPLLNNGNVKLDVERPYLGLPKC